jgi:hypothetical protein
MNGKHKRVKYTIWASDGVEPPEPYPVHEGESLSDVANVIERGGHIIFTMNEENGELVPYEDIHGID